jgi:hypothetical protein
MTAGRTKSDMHWIRAQLGALDPLAVYLVRFGESVRCRRPFEIMNGGTILAALKTSVDLAWVAKINDPSV